MEKYLIGQLENLSYMIVADDRYIKGTWADLTSDAQFYRAEHSDAFSFEYEGITLNYMSGNLDIAGDFSAVMNTTYSEWIENLTNEVMVWINQNDNGSTN